MARSLSVARRFHQSGVQAELGPIARRHVDLVTLPLEVKGDRRDALAIDAPMCLW